MQVGRMTPAQKIEERYRIVAAKHLEVHESISYEGNPLEQIDGNTLRIKSFTIPAKFYDIQVDFSKIDPGKIISCSCPHFCMHFSCSKYIALVILLIPQMRLKSIELKLQEGQTDYKRHALEVVQKDYDELMADSSMPSRGSIYMQQANQLELLKSKDAPWGNQETIDYHMAQVVRLMEQEVNSEMAVKRQKQEH
jgi:hypothetical protein